MRFRIYYDDGSTYSDRDGEPFYARPYGVEVVAIESASAPSGVALQHGLPAKHNWVWKNDGLEPAQEPIWHLVDEAGLWDYLLMYRGPKAVLIGRTIRNEAFWALMSRASKEGLG